MTSKSGTRNGEEEKTREGRWEVKTRKIEDLMET
jgi:hypothetical protein